MMFAISSSVNAFNVVVLILPRLVTFSPNSIAASLLEAPEIPVYCHAIFAKRPNMI